MKVSVGSQNPIKIKAVQQAFQKVFGDCQITGHFISSEVSHTPMTFEELMQGAKNRAKKAIKQTDADFGVGLEGGLESTKFGTFLIGVAAVVDKKGIWGLGRGSGFLMPEKIVREVKKGKELGDVMDEIRGLKNTKQHDGAVGFFTKNLIIRAQSFETTIIYALSRFMKPEMFE